MQLKTLKGLSVQKQLAFSYLTCERLYPNYLYFSNTFEYGNPDILRNAIDFLYQKIFDHSINKKIIETLIEQVEQSTPDTEDFSTIFVSSALDACNCVADSLEFLIENDFTKIENISSYALDTVDMYVRNMEDIAGSREKKPKINEQHHFIKDEVSIQSAIVSYLFKKEVIDSEDIETLLNIQSHNKNGSLALL